MLNMFRFSQYAQKGVHMFRTTKCLEMCLRIQRCMCLDVQKSVNMFRITKCLEMCLCVQRWMCLALCLGVQVIQMFRSVYSRHVFSYMFSCLANLDAQQSAQVFTHVLIDMLRCLLKCLGVHNIMCLARCFSNLYIQQNI